MDITNLQVVELLIDERNDVEDYSFVYPYFSTDQHDGFKVCYGLFDFSACHSGIQGIIDMRFDTASEAEDFIIYGLE